jgi:hypothetical protein
MTNPDPNMTTMDDHELLHIRDLYNMWAHENAEHRDRADMELRRRLEQRGATKIFDEDYTCTLEMGTPTIDLNIMAALKELLPPDVLAEGFTPEHDVTETVPDKWDLRKANTWMQAGGDVAEVIERAKIFRSPRLVVRAKEITK